MPNPPDTQLRRARAATAALFFTNGALFANLVPRYPEIKADLGLSNGQFGLAVAGFPVGAMAVGLLLAGAMDALADVAQNSQGLRVQKGYGRSILYSLHGIWSVGGLLGALAAGAALPRGLHLGASVLVFGSVALLAFRWMLHDDPVEPAVVTPAPAAGAGRRISPGRLRTFVVLGALVLIGGGGGVIEDSGSWWAAIFLSDELGATAFVAGTGFIALQGMQCVGRSLGDGLVALLGPGRPCWSRRCPGRSWASAWPGWVSPR